MAIRARIGSMADKFGFDNAVEMAAEAVERCGGKSGGIEGFSVVDGL